MRVVYIDLPALDQLVEGSLGLFCWSDVRPLAGVSGYVDWRLEGALSQALQSRLIEGKMGDVLMYPTHGRRLGTRRFFLFGLGASQGWDEALLRKGCQHACGVMRQAGASQILLGAPASAYDSSMEAAFLKAVRYEATYQKLGKVEQVLLEKLSYPV